MGGKGGGGGGCTMFFRPLFDNLLFVFPFIFFYNFTTCMIFRLV